MIHVVLTPDTSIDIPEDSNLLLITQAVHETETELAKKIFNDFAFAIKCGKEPGFEGKISDEEVTRTIDEAGAKGGNVLLAEIYRAATHTYPWEAIPDVDSYNWDYLNVQ